MPTDWAAANHLLREQVSVFHRASIREPCRGSGTRPRRRTRESHLQKRHAGHVEYFSASEAADAAIHGVAPRPEIFTAYNSRLRSTANQALKRVRVRIDKTRKQAFAREVRSRDPQPLPAEPASRSLLPAVVDQQASMSNESTLRIQKLRKKKRRSRHHPFSTDPNLAHWICAHFIDNLPPVLTFKDQKIRAQSSLNAPHIRETQRACGVRGSGDNASWAVSPFIRTARPSAADARIVGSILDSGPCPPLRQRPHQ